MGTHIVICLHNLLTALRWIFVDIGDNLCLMNELLFNFTCSWETGYYYNSFYHKRKLT